MPRLTEASRIRRRDDIAAAAMRCFARDGFSTTTMADIVREAKTSSGSVYSNFANKAELVRYAASAALRDLTGVVPTQSADDLSPASLLSHLLQASSDRVHAQTLLQIWAEAPRDRELADIAEQTTLELRELLVALLTPWSAKRALAAGSAEQETVALADAVLSVLQGFLVRVSIDGGISPQVLASRTIGVFTRL
jgi:AcrR family transcriptional regulator